MPLRSKSRRWVRASDTAHSNLPPATAGGATGPGRRYLKKSIRFNIELQPLEVIVDYLWYLQATWPGLKVEELNLKPQKTREGTFQGWNAQVLVTTFKAKPAGQR